MTDLREQLARALGAGYSIERELGGGGMSRVFVAYDANLGRKVVVKVLPQGAAAGVSAERFKREIVLAASLQHPHIVPLLSAGETEGLPYFTMPLVEGESLRLRLAQETALPVTDAVRVLRDLASALAYAHKKGIVHRDIKPENILITDAHAVVLDFGVAKALHAATSGDERLTSVGIALGTPAYMAPEQAAADPSADQRTDIYAFGAVAYEVLTGRAPFAGRPPQAVIIAHLTEAPEPITARRSTVPASIAALVMQCLAKDPADRPQRADDLLRVLENHAVPRVNEEAQRPSVAVLPMVNTSGDAENEHFSDGLTDELIGALSQVTELSVCGRTSVFALKGKGMSVRAITETLRVANVLEGSVRRAGNRLKARVQLTNADGTVLWSDAYDRTMDDVFTVQEEIAQSVVKALKVHLGAARGPLVRPGTADLAAYDLFLKGRLARRSFAADSLNRAIDCLERAVARDPTYATAMAWLSDAHALRVIMLGRPAREEMPPSRAYAIRAVALDSDLADAHWALGQVHMRFDRDWREAGTEFERAIALDPGHVDARHLYGINLYHQGYFDEAVTELTKALEIDPLLAEAHQTLGRVFLSTHQLERAIGHFREALELSPGFAIAHANLGFALLQSGRAAEAVPAFEAAARTPRGMAMLAYGYAATGQREAAMEILGELCSAERERDAPPFQVAIANLGLGDTDKCFQWLERAVTEFDPWINALKVEPAFEPIRGDPRFSVLLQRLGFGFA